MKSELSFKENYISILDCMEKSFYFSHEQNKDFLRVFSKDNLISFLEALKFLTIYIISTISLLWIK